MFHVRNEIKIGDVLVYAHIYHDEKRKGDEIEHLMRRIVEIEERFNEREFYSKELAIEYLEKTFPRSRNLFEIEWRDNGFKLKRKGKAISRLINRMGKTILLTNNPDLDREDLLNLYRRKDVVEKMFDIIKNELEGNRLKVSSRKVMEGRLFLLYLSLIIYSELSKIMKEKNLYKNYSLSEVSYELKKLKVVRLNNGKTFLTELLKRQRTLFEQFDLSIPVKPSY